MISNEMAKEVLQITDKEMSYDAPHFTDEELSIVLSQAQDEWVKNKYNPKGNKYGQGFENSEKRRKDLAQLTKAVVISYNSVDAQWELSPRQGQTDIIEDINGFFRDSSIIKPNGTLWKLPKDLLWVIQEEVTWDTVDPCYSEVYSRVKPIVHDEYNQWKRNEFKRPYTRGDDEGLVWRLDYSREYDANTVETVNLNNTIWYRVEMPAIIDDPADYGIVVNNIIYLAALGSGTFTAQEVSDTLVASMGTDETYYQFGSTIYVMSSVQVNLVSGPTNQIIISARSYLPSPGSQSVNQNYLTTDYKVHELITDGEYDIANYHLRYIRRPRDIVVDFESPDDQIHCELDESTHREIIETAAKRLYTRLMDPRVQLQTVEEIQSE